MTGPVWDGIGVDPWLPERLAAEARVTAAEQKTYLGWWAAFSAWIVNVQRGVLAGVVPDAHTVLSFGPAWNERMAELVAGPITDAIGQAYDTIFGPDYFFDPRPAVVHHLAQVTNRLVRTPDVVFARVAAEIADGAGAGESIPTIAQRIEDVLSATGTPTWANRGVMIARTETISALNCGRQDSFAAVADMLGDEFENQWLSTVDGRTRLDHVEVDLQRVPLGTPFTVCGEHLMFPGDPTGSPGCVINCRCSSMLVRPGEDVDLSNRGFKDF